MQEEQVGRDIAAALPGFDEDHANKLVEDGYDPDVVLLALTTSGDGVLSDVSPLCRDCFQDVFVMNELAYIVKKEVWPIDYAGGLLCIGCLESRIGRKLEREDFDLSGDPDMNTNLDPSLPRSERLLQRLKSEGKIANAKEG